MFLHGISDISILKES